jgi:translation initiation factor IF-2
VKRKVSETLARLTGGGGAVAAVPSAKATSAKNATSVAKKKIRPRELAGKTLQVTEFVTASELASMMTCRSPTSSRPASRSGMMVSINQRLDAETLPVIADEYGFKVEFVGADVQDTTVEEADEPERVVPHVRRSLP